MPDYSKSKIYIIRFIDCSASVLRESKGRKRNDNHIYIGSTTQPLAVRFRGHKTTISTLYKYIQEVYNGDWSKCYIELYEEYKCNNKDAKASASAQLNKREGEIIRDFMKNDDYQVLNIKIEGRTRKEYEENNKEKIKDKAKEYYEINKDKAKEYYEINKDKVKEYYEINKDKVKDKSKEYYQKYKNAKASASAQENYRKDKNEYMRDYRHRLNICKFLEFIKDL